MRSFAPRPIVLEPLNSHARVLQSCRSGHLGRNEQQVVLRVTNEDIEFDAPLGVNYRLSG